MFQDHQSINSGEEDFKGFFPDMRMAGILVM